MSRNEILITHNGETMNISQWAKRIGISQATLTYRLNAGWPVEHALSPTAYKRPLAYCDGTKFQRERLLSEFAVLVRSIDRALTSFKAQVELLLPDADSKNTPGEGRKRQGERQDQTPSVAQDRS